MPQFHTVQDVLAMAIVLERASQELYSQLIPCTRNPAIREYLAGLIREERLHQQQLQDMVDTETDLLTLTVSAKDVAAYVQSFNVPSTLDYKQAVRLAISKEKSAQMLYVLMAGLMDNQTLAQLFLRLSEQEKSHRDFFEKEYKRICLGEN